MITKPIIKNNVWIDKLYYIFFPSAFKFLLRAVKLSLFLFCFSASINIQSNSKILIEPFSVAFSKELTIEKAKIAKAVWKIKGLGFSGTGFFISENKIVTNAHVVRNVKDLEEITIVQEGNPRRLKANKIGRLSIRDDLALLEVDRVVSDFIILPEDQLNSSNVYALGYPHGRFEEIRQIGVFKDGYLLSDNSDTRGASGSPLLNEAHQLVGILYQGFQNYNSVIDVTDINAFIKKEHFLCAGNVQECFKLLRESFEKNPQEVKRGKDSYNISDYFRASGDFPRVKWWLKKAAEQGFALAQYNLAEMYYRGTGGTQDWQLARKLFEKATLNKGFVLAQYNLAEMYKKGEGGTQDIQRARELYEKAAEQGYAPAQHDLARIYANKDILRAIKLLKKAAKSGYPPAKTILDKILNILNSTKCLDTFLD